jgi:probable selenate reductase FAD-binding subunit
MITQYHRPSTLEDAVALAARPDAVIVAGGTSVNAEPVAAPATAVDLQGLGLDGIDTDGDSVRIGATTRLQDLVDSSLVPSVLRDLARREAPNTLRNMATVGGTIGTADPESELLAGLLAFGARATVVKAGSPTEHPVADLVGNRTLLNGAIITGISIPGSGTAAADRTARTPMDRPIVSAVAFRDETGTNRLAMTGVAPAPTVVDSANLADLDPPSDFRGSSEYRLRLAEVLAERVVTAVEGGAA